MDTQRLCAVSGLPSGRGSTWRIQWKIHGQSDRAAGFIGGNTTGARPRELPQFLLPDRTLAIHRLAACPFFGLDLHSSTLRRRTPMSIVVRKPRGALVINDAERAFFDDVLAGLLAEPKRVPPKYFYDEAGSQLFQRITALPEYYLTRVETSILEAQ